MSEVEQKRWLDEQPGASPAPAGTPPVPEGAKGCVVNALTIDVEDYFQVSAFEGTVPTTDWERYPLRVERNTVQILEMLEERGVRGTFFVLGWVAARCPALVKKIRQGGHEIACHGNGHRRIGTLTRQQFREDIRTSKELLEQLTGEPVLGYRAPSYSISLDTLWAYDELVEAGFRYDSSVFPIRHDFYGIPDWPRFPFLVAKGAAGRWHPEELPRCRAEAASPRLLEFPITTLRLLGSAIPIAGGGYFRLFPYSFTQWALRHINRTDLRPFIFYLHPWEIDPDQPRVSGLPLKSRFRHYLNLGRTKRRFARLLKDFRFTPVRDLLTA